jgi:hypothetical protein
MHTNKLKITYTWVRSQRSLVLFDPKDEGIKNVRKAGTPSPAAQHSCQGEEGILGRKNDSFMRRGNTHRISISRECCHSDVGVSSENSCRSRQWEGLKQKIHKHTQRSSLCQNIKFEPKGTGVKRCSSWLT